MYSSPNGQKNEDDLVEFHCNRLIIFVKTVLKEERHKK